jgi:sugar fermentation stimulation protein A
LQIDNLQDAIFIKRQNRFAATVLKDGEIKACHVPNSGRLAELLVEGASIRVIPFKGDGRTACGLVMVKNLDHWVVIDAHRANTVAMEAVLAGLVPGLEHAEGLRREVVCGNSRFDMACMVDGKQCYIEVKCSTLCVDGEGRFPDAPTERGCKHLRELTALSGEGVVCHVLFVLQNPASLAFAPNRATDPLFADLLAEAIAAGVQVHALVCQTDENSVQVVRSIEVCVPITYSLT